MVFRCGPSESDLCSKNIFSKNENSYETETVNKTFCICFVLLVYHTHRLVKVLLYLLNKAAETWQFVSLGIEYFISRENKHLFPFILH